MKWYEKIGVAIFIILLCVPFVNAYSEVNDIVVHGWLNGTSANFSENVIAENITANEHLFGNLSWNDLSDYPAVCTSGSWISQLDDSLTCTAPGTTGPFVSWSGYNLVFNSSELNDTLTHHLGENRSKNVGFGANVTAGDTIITDFFKTFSAGFFKFFDHVVMDKDLNVTGNITAENVFLPAYVSSHTNDTIAVASAGFWYNVTFDHEEDEIKERVTHNYNDDTNRTFTIVDDGVYEITYSCTFQDSVAVPNSHVVVRVLKNNVEVNGFTQEEDLGLQDQDKTVAHSDLVILSAGDKIVLQFTSDDTTVSLTGHLTYGSHLNTGHINIKKMYRKPGS